MDKSLKTAAAWGTGYRADIDGLRAVAVLSVVAYHYGLGAVSGGFAGVDIFFVISGYLITSHLADDIRANGHAIGPLIMRFYDKRIRRIVPALAVVLLATLLGGFVLLLPGDYASTANSAALAAVGAGNLFFYWHTGYFDRASTMQPLLHMWSLGVEEQFYLVWPVALTALMWATKAANLKVAATIGLIIAGSLGWSIYLLSIDPKAAFYLPGPRAWELGTGALIVFLPAIRSRAISEVIAILGAALIVSSLVLLKASNDSLGLSMVPAVAGAALLIWPKKGNWTARILSFPPARFVGLISYSLYLWHWPVLVLFRHYANGDLPTAPEALILAAGSAALAILSWRFVEQPARRVRYRAKLVIAAGIGVAAVLAFMGAGVQATSGFPARLPQSLRGMESFDRMWNWKCSTKMDFPAIGGEYCVLGAPWATASTKGFLWGDSQAQQFAPIVDMLARDANAAVIYYHACPAIVDGDAVSEKYVNLPTYTEVCTSARKAAVSFLNANPDITKIILPSLWAYMLPDLYSAALPNPSVQNGLSLLAAGFSKLDADLTGPRSIDIVDDIPIWPHDPTSCQMAGESMIPRRPCTPDLAVITTSSFRALQGAEYERIRNFVESHPRFTGIFPADGMCDKETCLNTINGQFIYSNGAHLRRNLSEATMRAAAKVMGLDAIFTPQAPQRASASPAPPPPAPR